MTGSAPVGGRVAAQSLIEYALLIAAVAILVLAGGLAFGAVIYAWFHTLARLVAHA